MNWRNIAVLPLGFITAIVTATLSERQAAAQSPAAVANSKYGQLIAKLDLEPVPSPLAKPNEADTEITKLRKERYRCAYEELKSRTDFMHTGPEELLKCFTTRHLEAEVGLCRTADERVSAYARALPYAKALEALTEYRFQAGRIPIQDLKKVQFERLDIEIKLLEAKEEVARAQRK